MKCDRYKKFELGELAESVFEAHLPDCPACQRAMQQDRALLQSAKQLDQPIEAPLLWSKIENSLRREQRTARRTASISRFLSAHRSGLLRLAAVLVLAIAAASWFFTEKSPPQNQRVLTTSAIAKIEATEREYENAIGELEKLVEPKLSKMDIDLMLLYRDRLETIDTQILRCKEALAQNPGNAHIRRYLLAALQDKRETLREVNGWHPQALLN